MYSGGSVEKTDGWTVGVGGECREDRRVYSGGSVEKTDGWTVGGV